jgi:homoserine kinase
MRLAVRVPATCANLGPGFDCFGLALDLCNDVTIDTEAEPGVTWAGEGAGELPTDGSDLVSRAMRHVGQMATGGRHLPVPPLRMHCMNRIPLERGLGSSAAATVAGIALAYELFDLGPLDPYAAFSIAAELEGHPDNAAPAAYGGFTIAVPTGGDRGFVRRIEPHPELRPVLVIPGHLRVSTADARAALTPSVSREEAVFNVAHAALMVEALVWDPSLLSVAMRDRLHQDARLGLVPEAHDLFDRLWKANIPVCVSGSGPSLLAFEEESYSVPDPGNGWHVVRTSIRSGGIELLEV